MLRPLRTVSYIPCKYLFTLLVAVAMFSACQDQPSPPPKSVVPSFIADPAIAPFQGVDKAQVDAVLEGMTIEEKIGQLIVWTPDLSDIYQQKTAVDYVSQGKVGGLISNGATVQDFLFWTDSLKRSAAIPLLLGTNEKVALHNQFTGTARFPKPITTAAIDSTALQAFLENEYLEQCKALGIQFSMRPDLSLLPTTEINDLSSANGQEKIAVVERLENNFSALSDNHIIAFAEGFSSEHIETNDSLRFAKLAALFKFTSNGLPGLFLQENIFENETIKRSPPGFLQNYLSTKMGFHGLAMTTLLEGESPELKLLQGVDLFVTPDVPVFFQYTRQLIEEGMLSIQELDARVRRVLTAKSWANGGRLPVELSLLPKDSAQMPVKLVSFNKKQPPKVVHRYQPKAPDFARESEKMVAYFEHPAWQQFTIELYKNSVTLASDLNKLIPFDNLLQKQFSIVETGRSDFKHFKNYFSKYADFLPVKVPLTSGGYFAPVQPQTAQPTEVSVILLDTFAISPKKDSLFIQSINALSQKKEVVVVNFGSPQQLGFFEKNITFFQVYERNQWTEQQVAQALFGGVTVRGKLPVTVNEDLPIGASEYIYQERVSFNGPEEAGIATERLVGIDAIANTAIKNRVFPGCQVAVVKNGTVVYSKAFGFHTYSKNRPVETTDLYDIASVSKIASTTLAVMKLYEQNQISLTNKISDYIKLGANASIGSIKVKDLLIHNSGLQAPMPIAKFYNYRSVPSSGCNDIFCKTENGDFDVQIAPSLFFRHDYQDTIWQRVSRLRRLSTRNGFRYSDVNFYLLQRAVEDISRSSLDEYVNNHFYQSIGLRHLMYNPSKAFDQSQIVPTERDQMWRKTLVHGFVHDPSAALMGGVGGNAGIFANAEDMAVLFQVLDNDGVYGGIQYFDAKTIQTFTTAKYGNHRGLGFDKPTNRKYPTCSSRTPATAYGHNGFTGTCVWIDPENDLVYVFLSNRIHPTSQNKKIFVEAVRRRIHDVVYDALDSFQSELPKLGN